MSYFTQIKENINCYKFVVLLVFLTISSRIKYGQTQDLNTDIEKGVQCFQNADFQQALIHLERVSDKLSSLGDKETLPIIYSICGMASFHINDFSKSIQYNEKALIYSNLPIECRVQVLTTQLNCYGELSLNEKCALTIESLSTLFNEYKSVDIIEALICYYFTNKDFAKVIEYENTLAEITQINNDTEKNRIATTFKWEYIYLSLGSSFLNLNNSEKAILYLSKCLECLTPYTEKQRSTIYALIAKAYSNIGDKKNALKYQKLSVETE